MTIYATTNRIAAIAKVYHEAGYAVLPLRCDGSKATRIKWGNYPWFQLAPYWVSIGCPSGIGILCGQQSANLEVLDFDTPEAYPQWYDALPNELKALLTTLPIVKTPSQGRHVYYRCETIEGNKVLARDATGHIVIETRGQGGMIVAPGSPVNVHPTRLPYRLVSGNPLRLPLITTEQRAGLWATARQFNRYEKPKPKPIAARPRKTQAGKAYRPGDKFTSIAEWGDILEPKGWEIEKECGGVVYWRKPHSNRGNHHATTGYGGTDLFYCFSTEAPPFEGGQCYSKFAAYALLYHDADFRKAANAIHKLLTNERISYEKAK